MRDIVIDQYEENGELVVVSVGFQGYDQLPLLMVYRKYQDLITGETRYAEPLYKYETQRRKVEAPTFVVMFDLLGDGSKWVRSSNVSGIYPTREEAREAVKESMKKNDYLLQLSDYKVVEYKE